MIKNKYALLAALVLLIGGFSLAPSLWGVRAHGGLHVPFVRIPLMVAIVAGMGLFLISVQDMEKK